MSEYREQAIEITNETAPTRVGKFRLDLPSFNVPGATQIVAPLRAGETSTTRTKNS